MTQGEISHRFDGQFHGAQVMMTTTNPKKCQLPGPGVEAYMQISVGKAVKDLTLPKL